MARQESSGFDRHRAEARVLIGDRPVGVLRYQGRQTAFEYTDLAPDHPVLGQAFETDPLRNRRRKQGVPSWFSNLLPEPGSGLRLLLEADMGEERVHDFRMLVHIGDDLPGAVRIEPGEGCSEVPQDSRDGSHVHGAVEPGTVRFSLAGVQRKMSMVRRGKSLILPAHGQGGDVLVKFQDGEHPLVPENEFAMLTWAAAAGIDVATADLVNGADLCGLPEGIWDPGRCVLAVDRFDRAPDGGRIHQEDLAQVWEVDPQDKYLDREPYLPTRLNGSALIGRLVAQLCPPVDVDQYVRRLAAGVLMGNADLHLKNWSLVYPGGREARLSPAYDLVCVTVYSGVSGRMAFPLAG